MDIVGSLSTSETRDDQLRRQVHGHRAVRADFRDIALTPSMGGS